MSRKVSDLTHSSQVAQRIGKQEDKGSMKAQDKLMALKKTDLFGQIPEDTLRAFAEFTSERRYRRGEILFTAGDLAIGLYVIVSGSLRAFRQTPEGREQTIHVETAGATLAEVPVFDGGAYPSTVEAEEDTVTLFLPKAAVRRFLLENPEAALSALGILAKRLRHVTGLVERLSLQDVAQRLAAMLIDEAIKQTDGLKDGTSFTMPLHHQGIAARLGSVREVITRHLHRLATDGVVTVRGHHIVVLDAKALQMRSGILRERAHVGKR